MRIAVDASVAVKWFLPEIHNAAAARLLSNAFTFCAPDLLAPEFGNVIWKKVRRGELKSEEAIEIVASFGTLPIEYVATKRLLPAALNIALALDRTVYDSTYLALAVSEGCPLFTADRKFHAAALTSRTLAAHIRWVEDQ